jgi:hypothetical protein
MTMPNMNKLDEILNKLGRVYSTRPAYWENIPNNENCLNEARSAIVKMVREEILPKQLSDPFADKAPAATGWNECLDTIESKLKELENE